MYISKLKFTCFIVALCFVNVNSGYAYTVGDAISKARVMNEELKIKGKDKDIKKLDKYRVFSTFLPRIIATSTNSKYNDLRRNNGISDQINNKITIEQEIFSFGTTTAKLSAAAKKSKAADLTYQNDVNSLVLDVITKYIQVLFARSQLCVALQQEESTRKIAELTKLRADYNATSITDVYLIESNLEKVIAEKDNLIAELASYEEDYAQIVGEFPPSGMLYIDAYAVTLPKNLEDLLLIANKKNPALESSKYEFLASKDNKISSLMNLMPKVSVFASAGKYPKTTFYDGANTNKDLYLGIDRSVGLQIRVPILDEGLKYIDVRDAGYNVQRSKAVYKNTEEIVAANIAKSWARYQTLKEAVISSRKALKLAEKAFIGMEEQYKHGAKTITDLIGSQRDMFHIKMELSRNISSFIITTFGIQAMCNEVDKFDYNRISYNKGEIVEGIDIDKIDAMTQKYSAMYNPAKRQKKKDDNTKVNTSKLRHPSLKEANKKST